MAIAEFVRYLLTEAPAGSIPDPIHLFGALVGFRHNIQGRTEKPFSINAPMIREWLEYSM